MKKNKFKIVLFLLVLAMGALYAEEEVFTDGGFRYTVENGKASITDYTGDAKNLIIPEKLGRYKVTSIGEKAFSSCESLTTIEIGNSVTSIGGSAFNDCDSLTSIEIGNSVTSIGDWAFSSCESLKTIEIGNSVTSIGDSAFNDCDSLTSIALSKNNPVYSFIEGVLFDKQQKMLHTYLSSNKETSYAIPNGITSIGDQAFSSCDSLTTIEIPDSVTSIGDWAFSSCDSLITIEIPDSVTSIGDSAFAWCASLTTIEIPDSVTSIGEGAFYGCDSLVITIENEGSYAHKYTQENSISYVFAPDTSWLE